MKKTAKAVLDSHASSTPSKWREQAEYRRRNRTWIRKSQQIALSILERLIEINMSQKELAAKMDVSAQYISKVLKGTENLSLETISKFESILGIELITFKQQTTIIISNFGWCNSWQEVGNTIKMNTPYEGSTYKEIFNNDYSITA